jgi:hypothetical protein
VLHIRRLTPAAEMMTVRWSVEMKQKIDVTDLAQVPSGELRRAWFAYRAAGPESESVMAWAEPQKPQANRGLGSRESPGLRVSWRDLPVTLCQRVVPTGSSARLVSCSAVYNGGYRERQMA